MTPRAALDGQLELWANKLAWALSDIRRLEEQLAKAKRWLEYCQKNHDVVVAEQVRYEESLNCQS